MNKSQIKSFTNPDGSPGYSWNPITGCRKGCPYCYARKLACTRLRELYLANPNIAIPANMRGKDLHSVDVWEYQKSPFYPRFWPERLDDPYHTSGGKGIFVCDMSDLFGIGIPEEWTRQVLERVSLNDDDRFYLLTKQPQNLIKFSPFPDNCWPGVSATERYSFINAQVKLGGIEAKVKYISFEPLLAPVDPVFTDIDWVIIGAQTKPTIMPKIEWVQEIVQACDKAGVPVFLKDSLGPLLRQNEYNIYSFPEWAGTQIAVTGDRSLAPVNPHPNEVMRKLRQEMPAK